MDRRRCQKLSVKYYGPFEILKKISPVAYRLKLPEHCKIFPTFHIALLKQFTGNDPEQEAIQLPPLSMDAHPIIVPKRITAYRLVKRKGKKVQQVLIEWLGLDPNEKTWEDLDVVARLAPTSNLEDKVIGDGGRDVTFALDIEGVTSRIRKELDIIEPEEEVPTIPAATPTGEPPTPGTRRSPRPIRNRKNVHVPHYVYY